MTAEALTVFVGAFVDALARAGVRHACICPGSRSSPLALTMARQGALRLWTHLDERCAGFFAVGMAKALREPVAVVVTSGTAAANLLPAVVEAYYSRTPLLVLTADRPPEAREAGALQTIVQPGLYGRHVRWQADVPLPEATAEAVRYARALASRAAAAARGRPAGPVHLNFPFREPLLPARGEAAAVGDGPAFVPLRSAARRPTPDELLPLARELAGVQRGLIVCGPQSDPDFPPAAAALAQVLGWPLLADPLSQARWGPHRSPLAVDRYLTLLQDEAVAEALAPEAVLRLGPLPTPRPVHAYLQRHRGCRQLVVDEEGWPDPLLTASEAFHADPTAFCLALAEAVRSLSRAAEESNWARAWRELDALVGGVLDELLDGEPCPSEPRALRDLVRLLPEGAALFVGNSMPVRDLDAFCRGDGRRLLLLGNRGASGIDGVVSSALGACAVWDGPLALAVGDTSFYHDLNGLLAVRRHGLSPLVLLLHNDGGAIFHFLPQEGEPELEELFAMPHGLDFRPAAEMFGLSFHQPPDWEAFRLVVREALCQRQPTIVQVRSDRAWNAELHRRLWREASARARRYLGGTAWA
ncbi:MAG TPA: 2-succinyl-5-enolpyruvyl-6-hydroxy-3-cyclohexene-1-carboxylic-acid synthase [Dehalococcoidia bacterium]|nr:2-succinyl-5-enolpyruvyl-6-hydroxy-3-cyclohexene-1-carboxylic-acid synthase [Dehalococcoidia bacterium]